MADAVASIVVFEDSRHYVVFLNSLSDGTGESKALKVDKSTLTNSTAGAEAVALDIDRIDYTITGFTSVKFFWDHASDSSGPVLTGSGSLDFTGRGGLIRDFYRTPGLQDPKTADSTGDILLTSSATSGGNYAITLWLTKRAA